MLADVTLWMKTFYTILHMKVHIRIQACLTFIVFVKLPKTRAWNPAPSKKKKTQKRRFYPIEKFKIKTKNVYRSLSWLFISLKVIGVNGEWAMRIGLEYVRAPEWQNVGMFSSLNVRSVRVCFG